jgi:hypothetical protein
MAGLSASVQDRIDRAKAAAAGRTRYTCTYPEGYPVRSVVLVELSMHDETQAAKRAAGQDHLLALEMLKGSLVEVDGEAVSVADGSAEKALNRIGAKGRNLLATAFSKIHGAEEADRGNFLASMEIGTGT